MHSHVEPGNCGQPLNWKLRFKSNKMVLMDFLEAIKNEYKEYIVEMVFSIFFLDILVCIVESRNSLRHYLFWFLWIRHLAILKEEQSTNFLGAETDYRMYQFWTFWWAFSLQLTNINCREELFKDGFRMLLVCILIS